MNDRIRELLASRQFSLLREEISHLNSVDLADTLTELDGRSGSMVLRLLKKDMAAEVFSYLSSSQQQKIVETISDQVLQEIMEEMYFDDLIDFLEEMPANLVKRLVATTSAQERNLINQFLQYPAGSAGSIMTIELVALEQELPVDEALRQIRRNGPDKETIYTCYVVSRQRVLEGAVSLRSLVLSGPELTVADLMERNTISVTTRTDQEEVARLVRKYGLMSIPVVDMENRLVGIITVDDILDVVEEENTEDFQKMAAIFPDTDLYLESTPWSLARNRLPWLLILMVSASLSAGIIRHFEDVLSTVVLLAASIPMLMDTAGNAGSQSSTLIIRGMATGEILLWDFSCVIWKEFRVSILVGLSLAVVNLTRMLFLGSPLAVALTVSLTMILTVILAKMIGGTLPILAKRMKLDPAMMAGPLITTIVDGVSLYVYFTIAARLMGLA